MGLCTFCSKFGHQQEKCWLKPPVEDQAKTANLKKKKDKKEAKKKAKKQAAKKAAAKASLEPGPFEVNILGPGKIEPIP